LGDGRIALHLRVKKRDVSKVVMPTETYEHDFLAWTQEQAALLRSGDWAKADVEHIAQQIENIGATEKRELVNRLAVLLLHLLIWRFQPALRGTSWRLTIKQQRLKIVDHFDDNPSLNATRSAAIATAYRYACVDAERETGLPDKTFPAQCPWTYDEMMDENFWPQA
jgi:hypothetical protein